MQLPASLVAAISKTFPIYRAPLETDNLAEDIAYNRHHGGNGCLGVATADFDGSGAKQYLLGLTKTRSDNGLVVVARQTRGGWSLTRLQVSDPGRDRLYVEAVKPGRYVHTNDFAPTGDDRETVRCRHAGAGFGETEASETVACLVGKSWLFVQISD